MNENENVLNAQHTDEQHPNSFLLDMENRIHERYNAGEIDEELYNGLLAIHRDMASRVQATHERQQRERTEQEAQENAAAKKEAERFLREISMLLFKPSPPIHMMHVLQPMLHETPEALVDIMRVLTRCGYKITLTPAGTED